MFTAEFETLAAAVKSANELREQGFGVTITGPDDKPVDETQDEWPLMAMALSRCTYQENRGRGGRARVPRRLSGVARIEPKTRLGRRDNAA